MFQICNYVSSTIAQSYYDSNLKAAVAFLVKNNFDTVSILEEFQQLLSGGTNNIADERGINNYSVQNFSDVLPKNATSAVGNTKVSVVEL